ncbi:MAG TPA: peptidylprolyl isomerase [Bacteroidota bacterium]|nr:peptidylprolyl isomerase [Bacteroidota bacterium]
MALMTRIRDNLSKVFAVFAVVFILYIMLDWGMDLPALNPGGKTDVVGVINGKEIKYREFAELLRQMIQTYKSQTGRDPDEETERQIRQQVWNEIVGQTLIEQEIDRLGITVTDEEIVEIAHGPNPPEFVASQFRDSNGVFNRAAYEAALADPQNRAAWLQVEEIIRRQRRSEKLTSLLLASIRVTEGEIRQRFIDQNVTLEAEYVLFDPNRLVDDSLVTVTDDEVRKHYEETQEEFRIRAARRLKYVYFSQSPTAEDTLDVLSEMNRLLEQVKAGGDFLELAKTYSEIPATDAYFKHGELSRVKENAVFSAKKGDVVGPIVDFDGVHLIKILDERRGTKEYVRASHILLGNVTGPDSVKQIQKARDILRQARSGANFAELARQHSEDPGSASQGGDLGWTAREGWVKPFADAAFGARVGQIVGPVRSQFGWHIIKVTGRDNRELKIADLAMRIKASSSAIDRMYQLAEDFAYLAKEEGFEKAAEFSKYEVRETPDFTKGSPVPGIGVNDAVSNFAFKNNVGSISDPLGVPGGIAVFMVSSIRHEGFRPLDDVKGIVRAQVVRKKKMSLIKPRVDEFYASLKPGSDLIAAASGLHGVTAQRTGPFKAGESVAMLGRDPAFTGLALSLNPGEISKPFQGQRGYYIVKVLSKSPFDSTRYASEWKTLHDQILSEKRNRFTSDWLTRLRESAEIADNRDKFYR